MKREQLPIVLKSKTPKVYKNKKLNRANFGDFNLNDYQVFLYLVSKLGGVNTVGKYLQSEQLQREHVLTAKEFSEVFNVDLPTCYGVLKKAIDKLMKTDIKIENHTDSGFCRINICSKAEYMSHEGYINIKLTDDIMPYLAQVKQRFVLYNLKEIANFGSLYTTRLYELLQEYQETGWVVKSIEELRNIFAVGTKFQAYKDLKRHTFGHACQEINNNYDMCLNFEEIKEGRRVQAVKFTFKKTIVMKTVNKITGLPQNIYDKPKAKKVVIKDKINKVAQSSTEKSLGQLISNIIRKIF